MKDISMDTPQTAPAPRLVTTPNLNAPDDFYEALIEAHEGLSNEESYALNARLVLVLANHIGALPVLREAFAAARRAGAPAAAEKAAAPDLTTSKPAAPDPTAFKPAAPAPTKPTATSKPATPDATMPKTSP